jgi:hypothetical protein
MHRIPSVHRDAARGHSSIYLVGNARGPFIYFSMVANEAANEAWRHAVMIARSMGLVCFDPQSGALAA